MGYKKQLKYEKKSPRETKWDQIVQIIQKYCSISYGKEVLTNPKHIMTIGWPLIIMEIFLNIFIINYVRYTEIDWKAYMQEVEGFLNGTYDYTQLKGDTGPLVYPAGFVYLYSFLYFITDRGQNIRFAQYIFMFLYIFQLFLTLKLYQKTKKIPPFAVLLVTLTSYRIHSLYTLRLFNDNWCIFFFFISLHLFVNDYWTIGSICYSLAVSIKMNILLYAPCLLLVYINCCGTVGTVKNISICAIVQLVLGAPFLYGNFWGYIWGSFDLKRVFEHQWTVNYRFLPEEMFVNPVFHVGLLVLHIVLLGMFAPHVWRYLSSYSKLKLIEMDLKPHLDNNKPLKKPKINKKSTQKTEKLTANEQKFLDSFEQGLKQQNPPEKTPKYSIDFSSSAQLLILPFFVTNLIGIACARSLHYQFYSWYYFSLLYLVWCTQLQNVYKFLLLGLIELSFNIYPSTTVSSLTLHTCHAVLLIYLYKNMRKSAVKSQ